MNYILFDDSTRGDFLPLCFTKPVAELRIGIMTMRERAKHILGVKTSTATVDYLSKMFPMKISAMNCLINGRVVLSDDLKKQLDKAELNTKMYAGDLLVAIKLDQISLEKWVASGNPIEKLDVIKSQLSIHPTYISSTSDLFGMNAEVLESDYEMLTSGRTSEPISDTNNVIGDRIFLEEGAKMECATINTTSGPVYLGASSEVMEGSIVRGGLALGANSTLKLGAKIYGATTIGPHCKVGGEVSNCVFTGYTNKGHDGYLGNSVLGEWCNIGADSNSSNLKNNYANVKLWNYETRRFKDTGLQFCGLVMGDHSKCGINTMFNTGTVVGVSANIYGSGFPRNFVASYAWGGASGFTEYKFPKALETMRLVKARRGLEVTPFEEEMLQHVFNLTAEFRG